MVVSMVKPKWILPICRKCFYGGFHMTLECMDTKPLTRFWVHHNVSTQKGRPEPTNTPDQKQSRYHRQIHKLKSKITSGNNVMKSHRAPSVKQTEKLSKMHACIYPPTYIPGKSHGSHLYNSTTPITSASMERPLTLRFK
jgi:hypothetical protein